ncbi:hypothetical protein CHELA1G11_14071 [Hyphomicrobiales bacterium]|nr:hypothetical protein CHELA1G2_10243 [Hyphomicrobiales bacterium]CAH1676019.1 hypothetical protein CHELA1G11_14071 [Hyphomicrobiales bacterium]
MAFLSAMTFSLGMLAGKKQIVPAGAKTRTAPARLHRGRPEKSLAPSYRVIARGSNPG